MADLQDAFRSRDLYLVCNDRVAEDGLIGGRSDVGIRPSSRSRYERLRKELTHEAEVEWFRDTSRRSQQTSARILAEAPWQDTEQLMPRAMGAWEGLTWEQVRARDAVRAESFWTRFEESRAPGESETLQAVRDRVDAFLTGMGHRTSWSRAVAVAPAEVIAVAACWALGVELRTTLRFTVEPLSVTRLTHSWIGWQLGCLNSKV